jgi:hypothetical protein
MIADVIHTVENMGSVEEAQICKVVEVSQLVEQDHRIPNDQLAFSNAVEQKCCCVSRQAV